MQLTTTILGSVTLNRQFTQVLKGLQIDVFDSNASIGWLGGSRIKANGQFKFIINRQAPTTPATNYTFKIYKNGQLLHTDTFSKNLSTYSIDISLQTYEAFVTPAISVKEEIDYFIIKGQLLSTLLKPLVGDIILYEKIYKNKTQLMVTTSGADGYFEIKINSRFFVNAATNCKRILFLEAEIGGTVICTSSFFQDFTIDLFVELVSVNEEFKPVNLFTRIEESINAATNSDSTLGAITPFSAAFDEMVSYLTSVTCFELSLVRIWLLAKIYSTQMNINAKFIFAMFFHSTSENINVTLMLDNPAQQLAIDAALQQGTIICTETEIETFFEAVMGFKKSYFLNQRIKGETATYGELYAIVFGDNPAHQDFFLSTYFSTQGTRIDFWEKLAETWDETTIDICKRRLNLMSWVGCQTDMFNRVMREYDDAPEQMAVKSIWDWEDLIELVADGAGHDCIPNIILNNDAIEDKEKYYANKLFEICNLHYPMQGYSGLVTRNSSIYSDTISANLLEFIAGNPSYSFRNNSSSLTEDLNFGGMTDDEISDVKNELLCLERLANICNANTKAIAALRIMKITSALDITKISSEAFIDELQTTYDLLDPPPTTGLRGSGSTVHNLPAHDAGQMYAQAGAIVGLSTLSGIHVSSEPAGSTFSHTTFPWAEPVFNPADPTLSTMFGDMNTCCCEHCRSVYSPTAYFTDTLRFLKEYSSVSNPSTQLYEELLRRRADLKHIDLTCKNANTPIPYVDLVNEILESKIIQLFPNDLLNPGEVEPLSFQTDGESADLLSYPEHKTKIPLPNGEYIDYTSFRNVYDAKLNNPGESFYPWVLPFNLAIEESRVYLKHLGYSRYEAMQLFRPVDSYLAQNNADISPLNREIEFHNLIPESVNIIASSLSVSLHKYYGILDTTFNLVNPYDTSELIQFTSTGYQSQFNENLHILIHQLKISYTQLMQLLTTEHLNPVPGIANPGTERPISIVAKAGKPDDTCIITDLELKFVNSTWQNLFYERLHRHVRLHKLTGWSIYDIDKAIRYVAQTAGESITSSNIVKILKLFRWSRELGFSLDEIQSGWNDLDIYDKYRDYDCKGEHYVPPVYDILFKNKAVINPTDVNFADPNNLNTLYADSKATIMAAFKIDDIEFQDMTSTLGLSGQMTLTGLAHLHILAKICNYYKIPFSQFNSILQLYNINVNSIFNINDFEIVIQKMNEFKSLRLDIDYVQHLLSSPIAGDDFMFTTEKATIFYRSLQKNLKATIKLHEVESVAELDALTLPDLNSLQDDCKATLVAEFGKEFNSIELDTLQNLCREKIIINSIDAVILPIVPSMASKESLQFFLSYEGDFTDFTSNINTATGVVSTTQPLMHTASLLNALQSVKRLVDLFAGLKINTELYSALDIKVGGPVVQEFEFASIYDTWLDSTTNIPSQLPELVNFIRWIMWRDKNGISNSEVASFISWLMQGTINADFPSNYADNVISLLKADSSLVELFLVSATNSTSTANILKASGAPLPPEYYLASTLQQIADINVLSQKVAINIIDVFETLLPTVELSDSEKIRNTAKAKYEPKNWLAIAQPLQNILREKQREALVAFLIAHASSFVPPFIQSDSRKWKNENDLYAFLLIDIEMKPFALTSRIKQGICSLQLYMDRVLMNLERQDGIPSAPALELIDDKAIQWKKWRKWYRIWEANRKVFLYPENWIEPELRLDKTPLFEKLENTLMQDEITDIHVESAISEYLEALDEIGRLEPVTMIDIPRTFFDSNTNQEKSYISETYYFARTQAEPHKYYCRTFKNKKYTPWQAVDIDIKGEHVTAYYDSASDKVFLLWLNFLENSNVLNKECGIRKQWSAGMWNYFELPSVSTDPENKEHLKGLDIRLHWSELKNNKWLPSKFSKEYISLSPHNIYDLLNQIESASNHDLGNISRFNLLTNNKSIKLIDFFKSRLYVNSIKGDGDSMSVLLLFPFSLREISRYLHGFYFPDMFSDPVVMKDTYIITRTNAQPNTNLANQKFVNSKIDNNGGAFKRAWSDNDNNTEQFIYINLYDTQPGNEFISVSSQPINISNDIILQNTPKGVYNLRYHAAFNHFLPLDWSSAFYFYDDENTFLVSPKYYLDEDQSTFGIQITPSGATSQNTLNVDQLVDYFYGAGSALSWTTSNVKYGFFFQTFYHPHVKQYRKTLYMGGVSALLGQGVHQMSNPASTYPITGASADKIQFGSTYSPTGLTLPVYPLGVADFSYTGAYSQYNWEIFFHAPLLIANRLKENQRFEEAQKWYHYIFDPTTARDLDGIVSVSKNRFWKFRPFFDESTNTIVTVQDMMNNLASYQSQIAEWEEHPFEPHVIARMRILAYMKNVVMKYLDNLIAWADNLFSRDTIESINEATNLYVLALNIMGEKPQDIPPRAISNYYTFDELLALSSGFDSFSNIQVAIESFIGPNVSNNPSVIGGANAPKMLYFCIPRNEKLMGYWKVIADRLFKIRNSMNIEGIQRQMPLYEPEIDPALLVKAAAAGLSMETVMNEVSNAGATHYRFAYMLQKANELCSDVKSLGNSLLSALEKKDGEQLALLRANQELNLLEQVKSIKELQLKDTETVLESLLKTKEITLLKQNYYQRNSTEYMNAKEKQSQKQFKHGVHLQEVSQGVHAVGSIMSAVPNIHLQGLSSGTSITLAAPVQAAAEVIGLLGYISSSNSSMNATTGGYDRRKSDWDFQVETSRIELEQIEKNIISTQIKIQIAQKELENHITQIENSSDVLDYMKTKYTNQQLYSWMVSQISATYFQSYKLAYDLARKAERTFTRELPLASIPETGIIQYGYWDSLKKGLLAGDKLQLDLRRLDLAYIENNKREYELIKHVSLAQISPNSLFALQQSGVCSFEFVESLFELDFPSHYLRRVKNISISIPCIAGPYTTIPASLTLKTHKTRNDNSAGPGFDINNPTHIDLPLTSVITVLNDNERIATSSSQNDSGVFELNFRDERYVPFEGKGAISSWTLSLMTESSLRQFDYNTISDVIIHVKYSAREGGDILKSNVVENLKHTIANATTALPLAQLIHLKTQFANEWTAFVNDTNPNKKFSFLLNQDMFPFFCLGKTININSIVFHVQGLSNSSELTLVGNTGFVFAASIMKSNNNFTTLPISVTSSSITPTGLAIQISLTSTGASPIPLAELVALISELNLALSYTVS